MILLVVEKTKSKNMQIPDFYSQDRDFYLIEKPSCLPEA